MSVFTSRTAITAGAVAVAVIMSIGGVAVAQAAIDDRLRGCYAHEHAFSDPVQLLVG